MSRRFTNSTLCAEFARKDREPDSHARTPSGTMFFEGNRLYSYGHHFCIAELDYATNTATVTRRRYSVTTSKQTSFATRELLRAGWGITHATTLD